MEQPVPYWGVLRQIGERLTNVVVSAQQSPVVADTRPKQDRGKIKDLSAKTTIV